MSTEVVVRQVRRLTLTVFVLIAAVLAVLAVGSWYLLSGRPPRTQLEADLQRAQALVKANPQDALAHEDLAWVYVRMARKDAAIQEMRAAVDLAPENPRIKNNLALLYGRYEMHEEAIKAAQEAIDLYERSEPAYYVMGRSYHALGDLAKARKALEEAVELEPSDADARYALGLLLLDLGDREAAGEQLLAVKSFVSDYPGIDEALAQAGVEPTSTGE